LPATKAIEDRVARANIDPAYHSHTPFPLYLRRYLRYPLPTIQQREDHNHQQKKRIQEKNFGHE
jgi:hypothetical protein